MLDEPAHAVHRGLRGEPVPDVEDMSGTAGCAFEHVVDPEPKLTPWREQGGNDQSSPTTSPPHAAASERYALTPSEKLITGTPADATFEKSSRLCGATYRR